jgi:Mor family transcriptional regulator
MVTKARTAKTEAAPAAPNFDALAAVEHTDDVVEFQLRCVLALAPQLSEAIAQAAAAYTRSLFGGSRAYIASRAGEGTSARNAAIRRDYLLGERIGLLSRRYGVSERQVLRIIKGD